MATLDISTLGAPGAPGASGSSEILDRFLDYVSERKLELYAAQEEAILELYDGKNVILNTPTGSGKSLVATALHFQSIALGRRSIYTSPIKALVNEKFLALCRDFGPEKVGLITGDATVNSGAPIICCTAEILAIDGLRYGAQAPIDDVIMDEFHYYSDRDRGVAWQLPLLTLPQARYLLMSATLGDTEFFERELTKLNGRPTSLIQSNHRPVPLDFQYSETPIHEAVAKLVEKDRSPVYIVSFTQRECAEQAQNLLSVDFCTKEEKRAISDALIAAGASFNSPYGKEIQRLIRHGIGLHHAGLLPKYRILIEKMAQKGLLKIICGTDTLGVGVNIPIRTVLFTQLCKFDGEKSGILSVRDFKQISGRAGRKGFDDLGTVVVQAPEHVIENLKSEQKAAGDAKKMKKLVKRKPPEKGYVAWSKETFEKLVNGKPEQLISRFQVTHSMLLNVLARPDDGCVAMRQLIRDCHETPYAKRKIGKMAFQLFRSLIDRKIIEIQPKGVNPKLRLNIDLQQDFSLNQTLSLYLIDTLKLLDPPSPENPSYALDLLTLVESILENPDLILRRQLDRIKTEKMAELKMQGMDFDERIEELEKLEYPKPNRDFIYDTFNDFSAAHPWVGQENIRPKSIAREMYENFHSFEEYIREYDLHRVEGLLLRYVSQVYKVLAQTVPDIAKNDQAYEMTEYFGGMIRRIDSSLIDEWQKMKDPAWVAPQKDLSAADERPPSPFQTDKSLTVAVRNEVFRLIRALSTGDYAGAAEILQLARHETGSHETGSIDAGSPEKNSLEWETPTPETLQGWLKPYYEDHSRILTDPKARAPSLTTISKTENWDVLQTLTDPEGHNDWLMDITVWVVPSRSAERLIYRLNRIGAIA